MKPHTVVNIERILYLIGGKQGACSICPRLVIPMNNWRIAIISLAW